MPTGQPIWISAYRVQPGAFTPAPVISTRATLWDDRSPVTIPFAGGMFQFIRSSVFTCRHIYAGRLLQLIFDALHQVGLRPFRQLRQHHGQQQPLLKSLRPPEPGQQLPGRAAQSCQSHPRNTLLHVLQPKLWGIFLFIWFVFHAFLRKGARHTPGPRLSYSWRILRAPSALTMM
jgi:hypothetical protein